MPAVYLDHNSTSTMRPEALAAMAAALAETGNPSSVHAFGRRARRTVEDARDRVAALIGAAPADIVFTGGGSEANAAALAGCGRRRLVVSAIEHDSVLANARRHDPETALLPVAADGAIEAEVLDALFAGRGAETLVSVMLANNETGSLQPVAEIVRRARAAGALVHCDAIQAAGKIPVDVAALGVDLLSLSAHKLGGPPGVGALYVTPPVALSPLWGGGGQERGRRAGTENVPGIAGFGAAAAAAVEGLAAFGRLAALRDRLEREALARVPGAVVFGAAGDRLPNTSCLALPGVASEAQIMGLDLAGIAVSAGSACSSGKVRPSHVLTAMGVPAAVAGCAIRVSLGWNSAEEEIERFVAAWAALAARRRAA